MWDYWIVIARTGQPEDEAISIPGMGDCFGARAIPYLQDVAGG
jgi:hypothetical protein